MKNHNHRCLPALCGIAAVFCIAMLAQAENPATAVRPRLSLDGQWQFRLDPQREGEAGKWFEPGAEFPDVIKVPGNWQAQGFGPQIRLIRHNYQGVAWYRRSFDVPKDWAGRRVWLRFQSVCNHGEAYVNGRHVGRIETFISPYEFDVTDRIRFGQENTVAVKVDSGSTEKIARENLNLGDPASANGYVGMIQYFAKWGGIIGRVELLARPSPSLEELAIRADTAGRTGHVSFEVQRPKAGPAWTGRARVEIAPVAGTEQAWSGEADVRLADGATRSEPVRLAIAMPDMRCWTPDDPFLYRVRVTLTDRQKKELDSVVDRTGMREFAVTNNGGAFLLNGKPQFLRGVGYDSIEPVTGTPLPDKQIYIERLRHLKDLGFNCVRFLAHTPVREFFEAADEVGMLVQSEGEWFLGFVTVMSDSTSRLLTEQVARLIREHRNRPSWYAFSCMNEGGFLNAEDAKAKQAYFDSAYETFRTLDPTRFFLASDGGSDLWPTDIISGRGEMNRAHETAPARPPEQVFGGEFEHFAYFRRALAEADMARLAAASPADANAGEAIAALAPDGHWRGAEVSTGADLGDRADALLAKAGAPFSAGIWMKPKGFAAGDFGTAFSFGAADTGRGLIVSLDGYGGRGQVLVGRYNHNILTSTKAVSPGVWSHVGVTFDGTTLRLFLDGKPAGEVATDLPIAPLDVKVGRLIDRPLRGAADYRSRPHVWHEFNQTYVGPLADLEKEKKLAGGITSQERNLLERHRARITALGLLDRYAALRKISVASYHDYVKQAFESARRMPALDGYHWWVVSDIPAGFEGDLTDLGILDIVYQPEKFPDPAALLPFNSASVLLVDADVDQRVLAADEQKSVGVMLSHYAAAPVRDGRLHWELKEGGRAVQQGVIEGIAAAAGTVTSLGSIELGPVGGDAARELVLETRLESAALNQTNAWKFWAFPRQKRAFADGGIANLTGAAALDERYATGGRTALDGAAVALADRVTQELLAFVSAGGSAILVERNPDLSARTRPEVGSPHHPPAWNGSRILTQSVPLPFWPRWIRCNGNFVERHPALEHFPHGASPDFQLARLYGVHVHAADLSDPVLKAKLRPIVWGLNLENSKTPVPEFINAQEFFRGAAIGEARLGQGRLIHCGLWLVDGVERGLLEAGYLLDCLVDDALSNKPADLPLLTNEEADQVFRIENLPAKKT
jgi:hypothetical protein